MRRIYMLIIIFIFTSILMFGQERQDMVYMKNGTIYQGIIVEDVLGDYIVLKLSDGTSKKLLYIDIEKREIVTNSKKSVTLKQHPRHLTYGVRMGMSMSTFVGDNYSQAKFKNGFVAGAFINIPIEQKFSIQPELLYAQHGEREEYAASEFSLKTQYLEVPVLLALEVSVGEKIRLDLYPGLGIGFNLSSTLTAKKNGKETTTDVSDKIEKVNIFSTVGGAFSYKIGVKTALIFDCRVNSGLSSLLKQSDITTKDFSIYFSTGISF